MTSYAKDLDCRLRLDHLPVAIIATLFNSNVLTAYSVLQLT